jgi:hypothetical protein
MLKALWRRGRLVCYFLNECVDIGGEIYEKVRLHLLFHICTFLRLGVQFLDPLTQPTLVFACFVGRDRDFLLHFDGSRDEFFGQFEHFGDILWRYAAGSWAVLDEDEAILRGCR